MTDNSSVKLAMEPASFMTYTNFLFPLSPPTGAWAFFFLHLHFRDTITAF